MFVGSTQCFNDEMSSLVFFFPPHPLLGCPSTAVSMTMKKASESLSRLWTIWETVQVGSHPFLPLSSLLPSFPSFSLISIVEIVIDIARPSAHNTADSEAPNSPAFVERMSHIPFVNSALRVYEQGKASSRVVKVCVSLSSFLSLKSPFLSLSPQKNFVTEIFFFE